MCESRLARTFAQPQCFVIGDLESSKSDSEHDMYMHIASPCGHFTSTSGRHVPSMCIDYVHNSHLLGLCGAG